ncbi:MAG TPA: chemotaxis protein CheW [Chloroflexota bacterium]|nr:chemotaxis protein CheW [Chloroflexota bacterium]
MMPSAPALSPTSNTLAASSDECQLVVFHLGAELYGVEISRVHEIIRLQAVTRVPHSPVFVEGVINLRGKVISVINLRRRFGLPAADDTRAGRIVVVDINDQVIGMVVDGVSEVLRVSTSTIEPPSPAVAGIDSEYLEGIVKLPERLVILLDLDRVLTREERRALEEAA